MINRKLNVIDLQNLTKKIRLHGLDMALAAGKRGAHISGSLSCAEIYATLFGAVMNYDIENPLWDDRDRFIAGKEHARLTEYPTMAECGFFSLDLLHTFEENDGALVGHQRNIDLGFEYCSMSLGMELSYAVGKAIIAQQLNKGYRLYVLLGDAECEEGAIWEAVTTASHYHLANLTVIIDRNYMSVDGNTEDLMAQLDMQKKFESFGWEAASVDGHNISQLLEALTNRPFNKPYAIIANTVKGKGVSFIENNKEWHQKELTENLYRQAIEEINNNY